MAELLAPAGTLEKLIFAANYGADAVYFGLKQYSLRSFAGNLTLEEAARGLDYLHRRGKRGYCTLNIFPFDDDYAPLLECAKALEASGVDGLIVADLGLLAALKKIGLSTPVHISTQANTLSATTALVYRELGASRVNLARELSFDQIARIREAVEPSGLQLEVFIHGAVCFSYSGRCAISDYLASRSANRGACTQPCRWHYQLIEEKRPGVTHPVEEDERGTYFFNSKDLALVSHTKKLHELGITSLKIEGRMKSIHYIAQVVSLYRRLLDGDPIEEATALGLLGRVSNRGYSRGFIKGSVTPDDYDYTIGSPTATSLFLGEVTEQLDNGRSLLQVRNKICASDQVEVLQPDGSIHPEILPGILTTADGEKSPQVTHGVLELPLALPQYSIIRKSIG